MNIKLIPLQEHEKENFIRNIQIAFKKAVVEQFGPFNGNLWFGAVLPITAAVLFALMVAFDDEEMLYWTAVSVWLIWICGLIWMSGSAMTFITHL